MPSATINAIHTLAGLEDFARVNAHNMPRKFVLGLSNERFSRCCLGCLAQNGKRFLDSEWRALFDCPSHAAARGSHLQRNSPETRMRKVPEQIFVILSLILNLARVGWGNSLNSG